MLKNWRQLLKWPLAQLLPNHCYLCGAPSNEFLCSGCAEDLPTASRGCHCCALPLASAAVSSDSPSSAGAREWLCGECLSEPKPFATTVAAFTYSHPIDFLINRFKHQRHFRCGEHLSEHLTPLIRDRYRHLPDVLLPVPLHWTRSWTRGFNQCDVIAQHLHRQLQIPVLHCCRRLKRNPRQQGLKRKVRLRNLRRAFAVCGDVTGKHIAVIDDVMTTGATVTELARCLLKAGATQVDIWVLARVA